MNTRFKTALAIGSIILFCIYFGKTTIAFLFLLISVLGCRELTVIFQYSRNPKTILFYSLVGLIPFIILYFFDYSDITFILFLWVNVFICFILIMNLYLKNDQSLITISYPISILYWSLSFSLGAYVVLICDNDVRIITFGIMLLLWTSDSMAYITGKRFGRNKLFASVSPNKTIEGSVGAGFFTFLIALLFAYVFSLSMIAWFWIGIIIWIIGTYGDLVESKIKRMLRIKDSGSILPGHGGILDRFDSLSMIIPFLLLLFYL